MFQCPIHAGDECIAERNEDNWHTCRQFQCPIHAGDECIPQLIHLNYVMRMQGFSALSMRAMNVSLKLVCIVLRLLYCFSALSMRAMNVSKMTKLYTINIYKFQCPIHAGDECIIALRPAVVTG